MKAGEAWTPALLAKLRAGDAEAGAVFDQQYRERLVRFCLGYLRNREEAEDAAGDAVVRVLRSNEVPDDFRAWLLRIARNVCLNRLRDAGPQVHETLAGDADWAASATGALTQLARADRRAELARAIERLAPHERELLRLRYADELSREELAEVLGLPPSVVKSRLFEALEKLRAFAGAD